MIPIPKFIADLGLALNRRYYGGLLKRVYFSGGRSPSWFDHRIDLFYHWPRNLFWIERALFALRWMKQGAVVLDLFCGDGYFSCYFYSQVASAIDAVDKDPAAVRHARRWSRHPVIRYHVMDVVESPLPQAHYDVVAWFEAIEHLSTGAYDRVIGKIKAALGDTGVLVGSTPIVAAEAVGHGNWEHENEFTSEKALREFLERDFAVVRIERTFHADVNGGGRDTAYFAVSAPRAR